MKAPAEGHERDCALWAAELGAMYVTDGLLETWEAVLGECGAIPRWRWIKRAKAEAGAEALLDAYQGIAAAVRRQERLNRGFTP